MFGLEILDVVIGLMFVYLLLALLATAINEYVAAVMNLRGKELARGLGRLLDDLDEKEALKKAFDGVEKKTTTTADQLTEQFYNHPLVRPLATRRGWLFRRISKEPRLPSYIPARTFAQALLDVLGVNEKDADLASLLPAREGVTPTPPATAGAPVPPIAAHPNAANLARVLQILKRESPLDVAEHLGELKGWLENANLPADAKLRLIERLTTSQTQLQKLHDSVEVWFNNSMDRVSGAYKRTVQGFLFLIGLLIASCSNADTIDMWNRLSANDELRAAMARRAAATVDGLRPRTDTVVVESTVADPARDTTPVPAPPADATLAPVEDVDTTPANPPVTPPATSTDTTGADSANPRTRLDAAQLNYRTARARLDSMELKLGWTPEEAIRVGLLRKDAQKKAAQPSAATGPAGRNAQGGGAAPGALDSTKARSWIPAGYHVDLFPVDTRAGFLKLVGLLLTTFAISLGAPFWFDLLNKVISIRAAGRSPEEKPKSPQGSAKRAAEETPK